MSNNQFGYGGGSYGVISYGGILVTPPAQPIFDEQYLRNFVDDELVVGAAYAPITDTFNITFTKKVITINYQPTPYKALSIRLNGATLNPSTYTVSGQTITFNFNLVNGNTVIVDYWH